MLNRLKKQFFWKNFMCFKDVYEGDELKDTIPEYSEIKSARANISANKGAAQTEAFGNLLEYDRTLATRDVNIDMDENSILWLDGADPEKDAHNYVVARKAVSNNIAVFALKRVEVSRNAP